ncbi:presenilin family intramembrane aspartyl protease PSH [Natronocalculus amylovorans]|uniref:Presenilin-like membrane protease, A22 family n=1 Tax=Natronocalculus amylovorans TaxID=2917812 RepID=A0AAE3FYJ8_9EURY|nr:presenilin family intramembrane aspartyl protease PSH [Natronocalculus amylovorans]MCL9817551.1 hypothetical protein [Natronocalculus amylovorans]
MFPREYRGVAFALFLFVIVQVGALALVQTFFEQGYQAVENPDDPTNSIIYIGAIFVATGLMLAAFKYNLDWVIRLLIIFTSGMLAYFVFAALLPPVVSLALGGGIIIALYVYPEWYVIDTAGVLMGAGAAGIFGITFGILPALILLIVLAVYDVISVYGTEHMLDLADGVMDLKIPVLLIIPLTLSYSILSDGDSDTDTDSDSDTDTNSDTAGEQDDRSRDAFFIGLGDAVIPAVLIASAAFFSPAPTYDLSIVVLNTPALLAAIGMNIGLLILMWMVMKGRAHAGLPLLNGGVIGGYLLGSLIAGVPLLEAVGLAGFL